jgi:hypothetical protein
MTKFRIAALAALVGAVVPSAAAGPAPAKSAQNASFDCASPAGWGLQRRADGVVFEGARDEHGVAALIIIRYVGPGNKLYGTPDAYMRRVTAKPDVALPGWKTGVVEAAVVAGRPSKRVVNDVADYVPPHALDTKRVPVREEYFAVPASRGFYVLEYRAPSALFAPQREVFARVLESFKPKL